MITDEMRKQVGALLHIEYKSFLSQNTCLTPSQLQEIADTMIGDEWIDKYQLQCEKKMSILSITVENFTFLWDETYERVVSVYGASKDAEVVKRRDKPRIAYYYRNFIRRYQPETKTDTGHFIAHSLGGGLDMNLFPQKRDVNQGRSAEGKLYRKMENYAFKYPRTFVFSRPLYFDDTWRPYFLEYGLLKKDGTLWIHLFDNI